MFIAQKRARYTNRAYHPRERERKRREERVRNRDRRRERQPRDRERERDKDPTYRSETRSTRAVLLTRKKTANS